MHRVIFHRDHTVSFFCRDAGARVRRHAGDIGFRTLMRSIRDPRLVQRISRAAARARA